MKLHQVTTKEPQQVLGAGYLQVARGSTGHCWGVLRCCISLERMDCTGLQQVVEAHATTDDTFDA
jgi:hypothetical protein